MHDDSLDRFFRRRLARRRVLALGGGLGAAAVLSACGSGSDAPGATASNTGTTGGTGAAAQATATNTGTPEPDRPAGWEAASHGRDAEPDYDVVFPTGRVNTLQITIPAETWTAMLADMTALYGERGTGTGRGGGGGGGFQPGAQPGGNGGFQPGGAGGPGGGQGVPQQGPGGGFGGGGALAENPMWVPATITFDGRTWTSVGVRFKGNSSLRDAWNGGTDKFPWKFDFDEFENDYPEIDNQRFFGFKQLALNPNHGDASLMRETVAYGLFERAGLVASKTATYEILLDRGEGPASLGLYTVVEVVDDTVIDRSFAEGGGNIYEAEGSGATLAAGAFDQIEASFQAEGGDNPDWSDVRALHTALHAGTRTSDPARWRQELEARFDVDVFLRWLGLSAVIQHWDTYGQMSHNYYLYNDPSTGRLTWITWDHNFVLSAGGGGGPGGRGSASLDRAEVTESWPLIRFLLDDDVYAERYVAHLREIADAVFDAEALVASYDERAAILRPHLATAAEQEAFSGAVESLAAVTRQRGEVLRAFLDARPS